MHCKYVTFSVEQDTYSDRPVADPGFPIGGVDPLGGRGHPTQVIFGKNVCKNERIGSRRGCAPGTPPRSANADRKAKRYKDGYSDSQTKEQTDMHQTHKIFVD